MGHRNMRYTGPVIDMEMDQQGQGHLHPEPCVLYGSMTNFLQPNIPAMLPAPGNRNNFDGRHLREHHGASSSYAMAQYNGVQHQYPVNNLDLAASTASNHYNMYMTPSGTRVFPVQLNHGPHDQVPLSSNQGIVNADSYGRSSQITDGSEGSFKRKVAEGLSRDFQYSYASAGSSSSAAPMNVRTLETDATSMDAAPYAVPYSRTNDMLDVGSHRSARNNRSGANDVETIAAHNATHLTQGHYPGRPFQTARSPWLDQQFHGGAGDISTLSWNQAHALPFLHGNLGCLEAANMGVQGYQVTASSSSSAAFLPPPPIPQGHFSIHRPPPPMQGARGHNIDLYSQVATSSRRTSHANMNPFQDCGEAGPRFLGTGLRIYQPHRREMMMFEETARQRNLPHLRVLPEDGVALLELSEYDEIGDSIDYHSDMRLDIDHMSYEELLALGEQIGTVGSGLSEESIVCHLKLRTYVSSTSFSNTEGSSFVDQELNFCVICQDEYNVQEKIGILNCGHDYHVECIKKWLLVKNSCPVCKSSALTTERKEP